MTTPPQEPTAAPLYVPYQRGDLRQAFVDAAVVMVRERGEAGFSLNKLARHLGVSPGAAYRHFANKEALLSTVCAAGYRQLAEALRAPGLESLAPASQVRTLAVRYIEFAAANPDMFTMMFSTHSLDVEAVGEDTFHPLARAVHAAQEARALPSGDTRALSGAVWMAVHGITTLHLTGRLATLGFDDTPEGLVGRFLTVQFPGLN